LLVVLILAILAASGGWYGWTGYIRTGKKCGRCNGLGFEPRRSFFSNSAYKECSRCHGYGRVQTAAARHRDRRRQRAGKRTTRRVYR
jgi:DnaJ-class molecular chaperone